MLRSIIERYIAVNRIAGMQHWYLYPHSLARAARVYNKADALGQPAQD